MSIKRDRKPVVTVTGKDCIKDTFCTGGPGGQAQNKVASGVRFTHPPSGAVGESRTHRSQEQNKKAAWERMCKTAKFQAWIKMEHGRRMGIETVEQRVEREMAPHNLKTEVLDEGQKWQERKPEDLEGDES
jgi:protein subunit release factor A